MSHISPRFSHAPRRGSRFLYALLASSAALAIVLGLVACQDTFSNPLPLYDAAAEDGNGLTVDTGDSGSDASDDASAGDASDAARSADAGDAGDATLDGSEASDSGDASVPNGGDASSDADAG